MLRRLRGRNPGTSVATPNRSRGHSTTSTQGEGHMTGRRWLGRAAVLVVGATALAIPVAQAVGPEEPSKVFLEHVSQSVVTNWWAHHPDQAPDSFAKRLAAIRQQQNTPPARHVNSCADNANKD